MQDISNYLGGTIILSSKELHKLVDLLWQCNTMSRRDARNVVVEDLPEEIRVALTRDSQNDKIDTRNIVTACQRYSSGFVSLIEAVRHYENKSIQMQAIDDFIGELIANQAILKKTDQFKRLEELFTEVDLIGINLNEIYIASMSGSKVSRWNDVGENASTEILVQMLYSLADTAIISNELPPPLKFVEFLSIRLPRLCNQLQDWVDGTAKRWKVEAKVVSDFRKSMSQDKSYSAGSNTNLSTLYLLIMLEPENPKSPEPFYVKAWLFHNQEKKECLYRSGNRDIYTSSTIGQLLDQLLLTIAQRPDIASKMKARLKIEFFLPRVLFFHDVDTWLVDEDIPLGIRNQVVIRSSERIKDVMNRPAWEMKWDTAQSFSSLNNTNIHWVHDHAGCDGMKVYIKLRSNDVVCLCFTLVPPLPEKSESKKELFQMIFKAGTPIALWPKGIPDSKEKIKKFHDSLQSTLCRSKLSELPEWLFEQRGKEIEENDSYYSATGLTLLWDDPYRLPPEDIPEEEVGVRK